MNTAFRNTLFPKSINIFKVSGSKLRVCLPPLYVVSMPQRFNRRKAKDCLVYSSSMATHGILMFDAIITGIQKQTKEMRIHAIW
ncbi:MAG: hypothetical protein PHD48_06490 [Alphaproteobacteria bacterium]|nr:hypothetical protein [Alphaproteobacteria bacterium]